MITLGAVMVGVSPPSFSNNIDALDHKVNEATRGFSDDPRGVGHLARRQIFYEYPWATT